MSGNDKSSNFRNNCGDFFAIADVIKKFIDKELSGEGLNTSKEFSRCKKIHYNGQFLDFILHKNANLITFEITCISE